MNPNQGLLETTKNFPNTSYNQSQSQADPLGSTFKKKRQDIINNNNNNNTSNVNTSLNKDRMTYPGHPPQSYSSALTIGEPIFNLKSYAPS